MKAEANSYLFFLEISLAYLEEYITTRKNELKNKLVKEKINYHLFCYAQIVYALKERLCNEYPTEKKKIEDFFENKNIITAVSTVKKLANLWKHEESMQIRQEWEVHETDKLLNISTDSENELDKISKEYGLSKQILKEIIKKSLEYNALPLNISIATVENPRIKLPLGHKLNIDEGPLLNTFQECFSDIRDFCINNKYIKS